MTLYDIYKNAHTHANENYVYGVLLTFFMNPILSKFLLSKDECVLCVAAFDEINYEKGWSASDSRS